jgi:Domain of unknown function (DUF2760)
MGNFALGFKALFRIWSDAAFAENVQQLLEGKPQPAAPAPAVASPPVPEITPLPKKKEPTRSEALTLLSVLQREARFVDFVKEPIAAYTDAQIGAAVRSVHKDCAAVLERMFAVQPLRSEAEGAAIEVPAGFDPAQFRLVGNIPEQPPFRGQITHAGWRATKAEVPEWTGRADSAMVVAPAEVEIR